MVRVFVVDDEPFLRQNIKRTIETVNSDFHVIGMAGDGETALEEIRRLRPDVVFVDVRMPIMDGLELLAHINSCQFPVISVILTGYSDFAYAQQALKNHAFDYILKPIDKNNLKELLTRIQKKLSRERSDAQTACLQSLLSHTPSSGNEAASFSAFHCFTGIYLCEGPYPSNPYQFLSSNDCFWTHSRIRSDITPLLLPEESVWVLSGGSPREHFIVIGHSAPEPNRGKLIANSLYQKLLASASAITCIYEKESIPFTGLKELFMDLKHASLSKNLFEYSSLSICTETPLPSPEKMGMTISACKKLSGYANEKQPLPFTEYAYTILHYCKTQKCSQLLLTHILKKLCEIANRGIQNLSYEEQVSAFVTNSTTYKELWKNMKPLLQEIIQPSSLEGMDSIVEAIHQYIELHFTESITLKMLADPYHISVSYLCSLYKKNYGISPIDDIISKRIDAAKSLLLAQPPLSIRQISEMVGYSDSYYFSRLFKVTTGASPSQYRKAES